MKKKQISLLLAFAMAVTSLAGCGQEASTQNPESSSVAVESTETTVEENKNFNEEGYPIVNEEITLKVLLGIRDADSIVEPDEMPAVQRLEELTGINLEWEVVKAADWDTKLNLMFASGEYPDVILATHNPVDYEEYGVVQKILIPLDELIDEYLPTYTERIAKEDADPTINLISSDGQTYAVGYMNNSGLSVGPHVFFNHEWLEKLNLEMPTDIEGVTDTLRAFKNQDFNGNGKADEIPFTIVGDSSDLVGVPAFLSLFGVPYMEGSWRYIDNDKQVKFVPEQEGFRECMEWLHMCYEEGLLDVEVFSQDFPTVKTKINAGLVGFTATYNPLSNWSPEASEWYTQYIQEDGALYQRISDFVKPAAYITVANEYPEATMRLFEAMIDKETQWSFYWGEKENEAKTYGWKYNDAGLIETWKTEDHVEATTNNSLGVCTLFFAPGKTYSESYVEAYSTTAKKNLVEELKDAGVVQKYSNQLCNLVTLTPEQNEQRSLIETEIHTAVMEHMAKFIKEGVTDNSWNAFQDVFKNMKVDEYLKMFQDGIDALNIE